MIEHNESITGFSINPTSGSKKEDIAFVLEAAAVVFLLMTIRFWLPLVLSLGKIALVLTLIFVIFVAVANAEEKKKIEGTYFAPVATGDVNGNTYEAFNFVSIVQRYNGFQVDVLTNFFNGHICSFSGVMQHVSENRLLYDGASAYPKHDCILGITWKDNELVFDAQGCRDLCGSRGGFIGASFPLNSRNEILMSELTDTDLCELVIGPDMKIKDMTEAVQAVLFARGVDLLFCRQALSR